MFGVRSGVEEDVPTVAERDASVADDESGADGLVARAARDASVADDESALSGAAKGGGIEAMKLLKEWGATAYDRALFCATFFDRLDAMELLRDWGATSYGRASFLAAKGGAIAALKLMKEWGSTDYDRALVGAARFSRVPAMKLLKEWGATDYDRAVEFATFRRASEAIELLRVWGATIQFPGSIDTCSDTKFGVGTTILHPRIITIWARPTAVEPLVEFCEWLADLVDLELLDGRAVVRRARKTTSNINKSPSINRRSNPTSL